MIGGNIELEPWGGNDGQPDARAAAWRERERQQRSVRFLMMFLLMMLLMDGEEQNQRRRHDGRLSLRKKPKTQEELLRLDPSLYTERREQDKLIQQTIQKHDRYKHLVEKNEGKDFDLQVRTWAEARLELEKDEFTQVEEKEKDLEAEKKVFHFPWNATGFYRGEWEAVQANRSKKEDNTAVEKEEEPNKKHEVVFVNALENEDSMFKILKKREESIGVYFLPDGHEVKMQNGSVFGENNNIHPTLLRGASHNILAHAQEEKKKPHITLSKNSGRVAFQLYSRTVPAMKELSILEGFVKLYDSKSPGYSTRRDILMRVSGVIIHSLGRISLASNASPGRSAFVIQNDGETRGIQRRLQEALNSEVTDDTMIRIRDDALRLFESEDAKYESVPFDSSFTSIHPDSNDYHRRLSSTLEEGDIKVSEKNQEKGEGEKKESERVSDKNDIRPGKSKFVFPYPFVTDDREQSIQRTRTPASRSMPAREQLLEVNALGCEFEITMDVREEEWQIRQWRALVEKYTNNAAMLDPTLQQVKNDGSSKVKDADGTEFIIGKAMTSSMKRAVQQQSLVIAMNGTVYSPTCNFTAHLNASALRTDWENTTGKAINYSFYMMLTCLVQIVLLLRQLLHTQAQSAATRVSLLCIGWQTILDALLCLVHIYLSLAMQPVFSAFASVAFFKLLIFCVIEMKYMAIIIQARNANATGNTAELLRRQIAMLHLRFYVALIGTFLVFFYAWQSYRRIYMMALYSFWVPQIIQNIIKESKGALHRNYVYGMSLTRMVAPLFIFCIPNNFLKEVYPDIPTDPVMCEMLIFWVGIQAVILEFQGRYGPRFMIPARFLPPKFDYSRPIPASMLPPCDHEPLPPSESLKDERGSTAEVRSLMPVSKSPHMVSGGTRNRIKGNRVNRNEVSMTSETIMPSCSNPSSPSFDCVICYNKIDTQNREGYMLAPCEHIFHRDCLVQWMEVKMECPVCRNNLPAL